MANVHFNHEKIRVMESWCGSCYWKCSADMLSWWWISRRLLHIKWCQFILLLPFLCNKASLHHCLALSWLVRMFSARLLFSIVDMLQLLCFKSLFVFSAAYELRILFQHGVILTICNKVCVVCFGLIQLCKE